MSTDLYKSVKYSDGEGITHGDLNDMHRFLAAKLSDQLLEKLTADPGSYVPQRALSNVSTAWAFALSSASGSLVEGATTSQVMISAGTVFQKVSNADGDDTTFLSYTFDGTDQFTLSAGHATLNRVDMIQMKLEIVDDDSQTRDFEDAVTRAVTSTSTYKKQRIQCTMSVKSGTAATNPSYPSPDAGYVPLGCVVIGATWAGAERMYFNDMAGARAVIHDLRIPLSVKPYVVKANGGSYNSSFWGESSEGSVSCTATGSGSGKRLMIGCPIGCGRLLGVALTTKNCVNATDNITLSSVREFALADMSSVLGETTTTTHTRWAKLADIEATPRFNTHYAGSGTAFTVSGNGTHSVPIWANGKRGVDPSGVIYSGNQTINSASTYIEDFNQVCVMLEPVANSPAIEVKHAIFYIAEGL